jgi:CRISPR-associated protein Cst2
MAMIHSLSLCARVTLDLHSLNNEGTEGNQQQTRMVHIIDQKGERKVVNAISGDMFKHILVEHLTPLLEEAGQPVSQHARQLHPDRILPDPDFRRFVKENNDGNSAILRYMFQRCAVTDLAGTLLAEKAAARKSCVEFGWVVGLPENGSGEALTTTEQYFHVKYDPQTREKGAGGESVEGRQAIFHRPASSGVYALICSLDLYRVGLNDITRQYDVDAEHRRARAQALVRSLAATLLKPTGAQRNTQNPHIVACEGVVATSATSLPAPTVSPLNDGYRDQVRDIASVLNGVHAGGVTISSFDTLADGARALIQIAENLDVPEA